MFSPQRRSAELRTRWGATGDEVVALWVGRLMPQKNPALLIATLQALHGAQPALRAVVVGDGPERQRLQIALPWAVFTGQLSGEALASAYASSDLFVQPSPREGFMTTVLEAQASGVVAVVLDQRAAQEQLDPRSVAIAQDEAGFIAHALRLAGDVTARQQLVAQGSRNAQRFDWAIVARQLAERLKTVVVEHRRHRESALPPSIVPAADAKHAAFAARAAEAEERLVAACALYRQALAADPQQPDCWSTMGTILARTGELDGAEYALRRGAILAPTLAPAQVNLGLFEMTRGRWRAGWPLLSRIRALGTHPEPQWTGAPLAGRLVLYADGGLGDTIQDLRFVPLIASRARSVMVVVQARLEWWATACLAGVTGCAIKVQEPTRPQAEAYAPLSMLAGLLDVRPQVMPPPLSAPDVIGERQERWAKQLSPDGRLRVGLCWQGDPRGAIDRGRSLKAEWLEPLAAVPGIRWIALQHGPALEAVRSRPWLEILDDVDAGPDAFADTCAIAPHLDLIITSDTSMAHVMGSLRRPTWLMLQKVPDWRWMLEREDTPWYPDLRLFRQSTVGDWAEVIGLMIRELRAIRADRPSVVVKPSAGIRPDAGA